MDYTLQHRAPKGGTVGLNGEFYEGGKFLPSTQDPKRKGSRPKKARKQQVGPYRWTTPEKFEHTSIYRMLQGFVINGEFDEDTFSVFTHSMKWGGNYEDNLKEYKKHHEMYCAGFDFYDRETGEYIK